MHPVMGAVYTRIFQRNKIDTIVSTFVFILLLFFRNIVAQTACIIHIIYCKQTCYISLNNIWLLFYNVHALEVWGFVLHLWPPKFKIYLLTVIWNTFTITGFKFLTVMVISKKRELFKFRILH
jgi:hypothetical protein